MAESVGVRTVEQPADAIPVWDWLIGRFRHFRQGEGLGRNPRQQGSNRPGRSHYSEPETIRRVTGRRIARHARLPRIPDDAFPRAELGLPIVFHFQDEQHGEPPDTVLYPDNDSEGKKRERMASPLVLKPLALQSGKTVPLILRLQTPALTGVDLRRGDTSLSLPPKTVIRDPRLAGYQNSPLAGSPNGSAIEAFIAPCSHRRFHGGDAMSHLLAVAVGPVQEFIATARRTRDLWFGSYLLSEISRVVAKPVGADGGKLIFPRLPTRRTSPTSSWRNCHRESRGTWRPRRSKRHKSDGLSSPARLTVKPPA